MAEINDLIDELQDLVDDKRERVAKLFADIRNAVPRPMTLVFTNDDGVLWCKVDATTYQCWQADDSTDWYWCIVRGDTRVSIGKRPTEIEAKQDLQSRFNAAWSAMTAKGAAT